MGRDLAAMKLEPTIRAFLREPQVQRPEPFAHSTPKHGQAVNKFRHCYCDGLCFDGLEEILSSFTGVLINDSIDKH